MAESGTGHNGHDVTLPPDADPASAGAGSTSSTHESGPGDGGSPDADGEVLATGTKVGRYIVVDRLGAGAMGVVYAAYDPKLDRKIALKLLLPQKGGGDHARRTARLEREAQAIAKLSHPNVVGIFDVVVHEDRVVLAMEYLGGGTLRDWVAAKKRPWREILKMFIEVGKGLAAAHAEGQIHRDFKPDNVLLDKNGVPKVVDFGLVRLTSLTASTSDSADGDGVESAELTASLPAAAGPAGLTRTGALAGTPAYMAPEQFLGKSIDARTDQFAFCVALYEALYGERPFAGETVIALAESVMTGKIRELGKDSQVPAWIRRVVQRGLLHEPDQRFRNIDDLLVALTKDPVARLKRRTGVVAAILVVVASIVAIQRRSEKRRVEFDRQIAVRIAEGSKALAEADSIKGKVLLSRGRAFAAFDAGHREQGERLWNEERSASVNLDSTYERAQGVLAAALNIDPSHGQARKLLAETLYERAALADLEFRRDDLTRHLRELESVDTTGDIKEHWTRAGSLSVQTTPSGAQITIEQYKRDEGNTRSDRLTLIPLGAPLSSPVQGHPLDPGSYRLKIVRSGYAPTLFPFVVKAGEPLAIDVSLLHLEQVPSGFVFIPAGLFLYGDHDEDWRLSFLNAVPIHEKRSNPYLIRANETTFGDWIEFLSALPPKERRARLPASTAVQGAVALRQQSDDGWGLELGVTGRHFSASAGQRIMYPARSPDSAAQDWLKMPVIGVSPKDMKAYFTWLSSTGRVPGARFCTDSEWEHAARGADDRVYPGSQSRLGIRDANFDATYGRLIGAYGPDEVGRHPASRSPFGVDDMSGNVWEVVLSQEIDGGFVLRGGCYYQAAMSARVTNREPAEETTRSHMLGLRVCADISNFEGEKKL